MAEQGKKGGPSLAAGKAIISAGPRPRVGMMVGFVVFILLLVGAGCYVLYRSKHQVAKSLPPASSPLDGKFQKVVASPPYSIR